MLYEVITVYLNIEPQLTGPVFPFGKVNRFRWPGVDIGIVVATTGYQQGDDQQRNKPAKPLHFYSPLSLMMLHRLLPGRRSGNGRIKRLY